MSNMRNHFINLSHNTSGVTMYLDAHTLLDKVRHNTTITNSTTTTTKMNLFRYVELKFAKATTTKMGLFKICQA